MNSANNPDLNDNPLAVQTVSIKDGKATAPKRRMSTPAAAWTAYTNCWYQGRKRDARFGDIAGIFAGFPPTPPSVLANNGIPDCPNINTKQFQSKLGKYVSTWNAVSNQSDGWFKVEAYHPDPMEAARRSACLTNYFNDAIRQWDDPDESADFCSMPEYLLNSATRDTQMGLFSIGVGMWEDDVDFRWIPIPTRRVFVPQGTRLSLKNCPAIFIEDNNFSVAQLWNMRGKPGWNNDAIERCLFDRVELQAQTQARAWSYSEWINYIRNNDVPYPYDFAPVRVVHSFCQEFDLSISHSIFCDFTYTSNGGNKDFKRSKQSKQYRDASQEFLFDKAKVATRWQQVVSVFADSSGPEGDWHGAKGFGDLIYDGCHLNNLAFNRGATGAFIANTLMFQGASQSDTDKMDQIVMTPMGIMAPGLQLSEVSFKPDVQGVMSIFQVGTSIIDQNSRDFPQNQKTAGGDQPTATQVNYDRADEAQFDSLQVETYRVFGDGLGSEMYRRLAQPASKYPEDWGGGKVAKKFRERCKEDGIPEADLLKVKKVQMNRNGGTGNISLDVMKADQALSVATPGMGQLNARKAKIAALWGHENVPMFIEDAPQPAPDDQQIDTENLLIQEGQIPTPFGWQDQQKHVESHLQLMAEAAQAAEQIIKLGAVEQNVDGAEKLSNLILAGAEHVKRHIALMSEVRGLGKKPSIYAQIIPEATKQVHNLTQIGQSLAEDVAKAKGAQQPQMSPEMMVAQQKMQIEAAKAQQDMELNKQAHEQKLGQLAIQNEARTQAHLDQSHLKAVTTAAHTEQKLAGERMAAQQETTLKSVENMQELANKQALHHQELRHAEEKPTPKTE